MKNIIKFFQTAHIQQLKSSVPKGDKKKRKEVNAEIELLESNLTKKHTEEVKNLENLVAYFFSKACCVINFFIIIILLLFQEKIPDELEKVNLNEEKLNKPLAETQVKISKAQKRKVCLYLYFDPSLQIFKIFKYQDTYLLLSYFLEKKYLFYHFV